MKKYVDRAYQFRPQVVREFDKIVNGCGIEKTRIVEAAMLAFVRGDAFKNLVDARHALKEAGSALKEAEKAIGIHLD